MGTGAAAVVLASTTAAVLTATMTFTQPTTLGSLGAAAVVLASTTAAVSNT